ncbi:MAG: DUF2953 domain-containing protein [Butyricicoccus pullicaecorum]|nr:DUF2953 domain-containing protein [Butyricicoccus pullicaecorum]
MAKIAAGIGILLALVLVLVFVLLCICIGFSVQMRNGESCIRIQVGLLHKTIKLGDFGKPVKNPKSKTDKPKTETEEPDTFELPDWDWGEFICELLSFLEDVKDRLRIDVLCVQLLLATGDAAKTGMYLGGLSALTSMVYPFLVENFQIRDFNVQIDGDFEGNTTQYDLCFGCSFRPIRMIGPVVRHGRKLYHIVKQTQSVEAKYYE